MEDKNQDGFFDEKTESDVKQQQLMAMVEALDKKKVFEVRDGSYISGTITIIGKDNVFVDIGQRYEAVIKKEEFMDETGNVTVHTGDIIKAYVISSDNDEIVLSNSLNAKSLGVKDIVEAMKNKIPVTGKVTGINKGGFNVTVMGKKAFCPFSHIDIKHVDEPNAFLLKSFQFILTKVENKGNNIVVSRLPLLEKDLSITLDQLQSYLQEKKVIKGTISKITEYGLFVSLGELEGLVHISEVAWDRPQNLEQNYSIGQEVECVILSVERKEPLRNSKISLSMKMVGNNPWDTITSKFSIGCVAEGTITRLANFGAFVQLIPGVEGLIHISEMSWGKRVRHPSDVVSEGQQVKVTVLSINSEKRSISCSLKDVSNNPWNDVPIKYPVGSTIKGIVTEETKYGFFIDLDQNITGLLVHGKIAKSKKGSIKKTDVIEVVIEEIDLDSRRISLSYGLEPVSRPVEQPVQDHIQTSTFVQSSQSSSEFGDMLKAAMAKKTNK